MVVARGNGTGTAHIVGVLLVGLLVAAALVACSGDDDEATDAAEDPDEGSPTTAPDRPEGPAADLSEELTGGDGPFVAAADPAGNADDYVEEEYVASGTATAYVAEEPLSGDGRWTFEEGDDSAPYRTRVLVRRPASPEAFSGVVVVEWFNVSAGIDANPDYASLEEELVRQGHAWVGVSAQLIGVEGGPVLVSAPGAEGLAGEGLKAIDPDRYGSLEHPGDGFSFDI